MWKASLDEAVGGHVAVKVFNQSTRNFFNNERDIYTLPFMDHANIVGFIGHQEFHSSAGPVQYRLILEYAPYGSLQVCISHDSLSISGLSREICWKDLGSNPPKSRRILTVETNLRPRS